MDQEILAKEMIPQPELWRCALEIDKSRIEVALVPGMEGQPLIHRTIQLNPDLQSTDNAVQEAVYANPLLLSDFSRIDVLIDTPDFCIVPAATAQAVLPLELLKTAGIEAAGKSVMVCEADSTYSVVFAVEASLVGFIRRTFFNVRISHILAPIIASPQIDNAILATVDPDKLILTASVDKKMLYANILRHESAEDATYYINAVRHNLPVKELPIVLAGNTPDALMIEKYLSKYASAPCAYEIPGELARLGNDALTLTQPLTALLICG